MFSQENDSLTAIPFIFIQLVLVAHVQNLQTDGCVNKEHPSSPPPPVVLTLMPSHSSWCSWPLAPAGVSKHIGLLSGLPRRCGVAPPRSPARAPCTATAGATGRREGGWTTTGGRLWAFIGGLLISSPKSPRWIITKHATAPSSSIIVGVAVSSGLVVGHFTRSWLRLVAARGEGRLLLSAENKQIQNCESTRASLPQRHHWEPQPASQAIPSRCGSEDQICA